MHGAQEGAWERYNEIEEHNRKLYKTLRAFPSISTGRRAGRCCVTLPFSGTRGTGAAMSFETSASASAP